MGLMAMPLGTAQQSTAHSSTSRLPEPPVFVGPREGAVCLLIGAGFGGVVAGAKVPLAI